MKAPGRKRIRAVMEQRPKLTVAPAKGHVAPALRPSGSRVGYPARGRNRRGGSRWATCSHVDGTYSPSPVHLSGLRPPAAIPAMSGPGSRSGLSPAVSAGSGCRHPQLSGNPQAEPLPEGSGLRAAGKSVTTASGVALRSGTGVSK